jgi:hypothetical protein
MGIASVKFEYGQFGASRGRKLGAVKVPGAVKAGAVNEQGGG